MVDTTSSRPEVARFEAIGKDYRGHVALTDVTLGVDAGEAVGLIGPNGAGKTTLLALLAGLRRPTRGQVRLFGGDPVAPRSRTQLGMAPPGAEPARDRAGG